MATTQTELQSEEESDSADQSSAYNHRISVQPSTPETSEFDRTKVVFVKVPASMSETFESGPERGAVVISDLFDIDKDEFEIDEVEEFAWPVVDGMVFAFRAYTPSRQSTTQTKVTDSGEGSDPLPEPLHTTHSKLKSELPDSLKVRIGVLPLEAFGTPALGTRLVVKHHNRKPAGRDKVSDADANALFEDLAGEPFLYHALYRRSSGLPESNEYQVAVRVFLFNPAYKISTESEYAECLRFGRECDPADSFAKLGVSSSLAVLDDGYTVSWLDDGTVMPTRDSDLPHFSEGQSLITGEAEFDNTRRGQYGASDTLEEHCAYTSLLAREIDLEHYVGLGTINPGGNPWRKAPQATGFDITDVGIDPDEILPDEVTIGVDAPIEDSEFDQDPATANDGTEVHWQAIKGVAVAFETEGYDVVIVTQDTGSRPDLWVRRSDGEIFAVEVEYRTRSKPGSFFTNLIRQAVWGYKTITVMVPQTDDNGRTESLDTLGDWALNNLAVPMKQRDPTKTQFHNCSGEIIVDGKTLLLPDGVSEANWWLTCEREYLLIHDGKVLARGDATVPFEEFEYNLPRYYEDSDHYVVENQYGKQVQTYNEESDIENTTLHPCHRPVDLSYIHFVEALYCYDRDTEELVQQEMTAHWDVEQASTRNERSHQQAFETFLVEHENDDPILERDCRPFIKEWIEQLSTHGHPGNNIYGDYRKDYHPRKRISTERGMEQSYPGISFRYPRGLISPNLPGLNTKPVFPDDWNIPSEDVLQEPLIYGLNDQTEIGTATQSDDQASNSQ